MLNLKTKQSSESYSLIGFEVLSPGSRFVDVKFEKQLENIDYVCQIELPYQTSWWVTNKSRQGFRVNFGVVCAGYHQKIGWQIGISF